jgi:hypothetical protein
MGSQPRVSMIDGEYFLVEIQHFNQFLLLIVCNAGVSVTLTPI